MNAIDVKSPYRQKMLALLGLLILTLAAYLPVITHGSFIWDDDSYITDNLTLKRDSGLYDIWFKPSQTPQYYPVVFTSFFFETRLYGDQPRGFIVFNVLLHAGSAYLIYLLLNKLKIPGALLAAALFAVHPMTVESVAWITERKNTFACFFTLAAALVYLSYLPTGSDKPRTKYLAYAGATLLFLLALLSKSVSCSLPAVLIVILWWQQKKFPWKDLLWLLPWFALGLIAGLHTAYLERTHVGADGPEFQFTLAQRTLFIGQNWWFYPRKFIWPHPLIFFYHQWNINPDDAWLVLFPAGVIALFVELFLLRRRIGKGPLLVAMLYTLTIFPALGFFNVYPFKFSFVADHFAYLALIPLAAGAAALMVQIYKRLRLPKIAGIGVTAALIVTLSAVTFDRGYAYSGLVPLFEDAIRKNPDSQACWSLYGNALLKANRVAEAKNALIHTYELPPHDPNHIGPIALACLRLGELDEAEKYIEKYAIEKPNASYAFHLLGILRYRQGRKEEAMTVFHYAYQLEPKIGRSIISAAEIALELRHIDKAEEYCQIALQLNPRWAKAHNLMGRVLASTGRLAEALPYLQRAAELENNPEYQQDVERAQKYLAREKSVVPPPASQPAGH